jgi:8-oxo-dGTP pyrophosphatase MutT (NUDIX family)
MNLQSNFLRTITAKERELPSSDRFDEEGYWAGEGNGASGVLPICENTGRICLAWRNVEVHSGNCWGTLGGALKKEVSPSESAVIEMREETGYAGTVTLHPAFVFSDRSFTYSNFIGLVTDEFSFDPKEEHAWETDFIEWFSLDDIEAMMKVSPSSFHAGLITLFEESKELIEKYAKRRLNKISSAIPGHIRSVADGMLATIQRYDPEYGDDTDYGICTNSANEMAAALGGKVVGYYAEDNPDALIGAFEGGHDFTLVSDRYLLDVWASEYSSEMTSKTVYDLNDPADAATVLRLYGPPENWKPLGEEHTASSKITPLQDNPEYVEGSNGWALFPDQREGGV